MEYKQSAHSLSAIDAAVTLIGAHSENQTIHMTQAEHTKLSTLENYDDTELLALIAAKADAAALTAEETARSSADTSLQNAINAKADTTALTAETTARQTAIDAEESARKATDTAIASMGAKNLLENSAATQTVSGVVFTVNADGSITANGTATATASFRIYTNFTADSGTILSGCPEGGGTSTYDLRFGSSFIDRGEGAAITSETTANVSIVIRSGYTAENLTFYPMVRAAAMDDSYAPYAPTNRELYEMVQALQARVAALEGGS